MKKTYLSHADGVSCTIRQVVVWLKVFVFVSVFVITPGESQSQSTTQSQAEKSFSSMSVKELYNQVLIRLQSGTQRKEAYEMALHARERAKNARLSEIDQWRTAFIYSYACQEYLDEHAKPYQSLLELSKNINSKENEALDIKRQTYHSLTSSSLLLNKLDTAVFFAKEANRIGNVLYGDTSCRRVMDHFLLAYSLIESARDEEALPVANQALRIAEMHCSKNSTALIDAHRLMGYYYVKSNYQASRALPFYQLALHNSLHIQDADRAFKSLYYICRTGILSKNWGVVKDHLPYFDSISEMSDRITQIKNDLARLDIEYTMARQNHDLPLAIKKKNEFGEILLRELPERQTAILDSYYAIIEMTIEGNQKAETTKYLKELNEFAKKYPFNQDQLLSFYHVKSTALLHINRWDKALDIAKEGIRILAPDWDPNSEKLPDVDQITDLYFYRQFLKTSFACYVKSSSLSTDIDVLYEKQKLLSKLVSCTIRMIERDDERMSKQSIDEIASDFEHLISNNIELYQRTQSADYLNHAFTLTDIASNLTFFRGIKQRQSITRTSIADSMIQLKKEIRRKLANLKSLSLEHTFSTQIEKQELDLKIQLSRINLFMEEHEPLYMANVRAIDNISVENFQGEILNEKTAFIQYFYYDNLYAFLALEDSLIYIELPIPTNFEASILEYEHLISYPRSSLDSFTLASRRLGSILLDPILQILPKQIDKVIITPYGKLANISYESLLIEDSHSLDKFGALPYLIKKYAISYAFSMSALYREISTPEKNKRMPFLGVAPAYKNEDFQLDSTALLTAERSGYLPLPGANNEVVSIAKIIKNGEVLIGENATKDALKQRMSDHDIWHFAMHAILDKDDPMLSALYFSNQSGENSQYLTAAEIYDMDVNADMVVLSACNTGIGKYDYVQGSMSLARAFAYAGAKSIILSSWPAPDDATSQLIPQFYAHLINGYSKEVSLQRAKLEWLKNTSSDQFRHPYYWSTFTLWGNTDPIKHLSQPQTGNWWWLALGSAVFLGLIWGFLWRQKDRDKE